MIGDLRSDFTMITLVFTEIEVSFENASISISFGLKLFNRCKVDAPSIPTRKSTSLVTLWALWHHQEDVCVKKCTKHNQLFQLVTKCYNTHWYIYLFIERAGNYFSTNKRFTECCRSEIIDWRDYFPYLRSGIPELQI